jgi:hypothetical protein
MGKSIPNENIFELIKKVKPLLDKYGVSYWLGRGVLGDFLANNTIKCKHSDVDFHIWGKDKEILKNILIPEFVKDNYDPIDRGHKLAFRKPIDEPKYFLEFMYLFPCEDDSRLVYHTANGKKCYCPATCFSEKENNFIEISNNKIRIPNNIEDYFRMVYEKDNWRDKYKIKK